MHTTLFTDPITLRPLQPSDAPSLLNWFPSPHSTQHTHFSPLLTLPDSLHYILTVALPHPYLRAICINNSTCVGLVSITPNKSVEYGCRAEVGYVVRESHWGKGIATRALRMVIEEVRRGMVVGLEGVERLEGVVVVENVGSGRVLEKAGFVREGVHRRFLRVKGRTRDVVVFGLVLDDLRGRGDGGYGCGGDRVSGLCELM